MTDLETIRAIDAGDEQLYKKVYLAYFGMVKHMVVNNLGQEEDAHDVFHDTMIVLLERSRSQGFQLTASLKTFIYSVARNIWYTRARKLKNFTKMEDFEAFIEVRDTELKEKQKTEQQLNIIDACIEQLGDPCKTLLIQFYYFKRSMSDLAELLGYQNADHAKSQKYKCMKRLKSLAKNEG